MPTCRICKSKFEARYSSFQKTCETPSCIIEWSKQQRDKVAKKEHREWKSKTKEKLMTLGDHLGLLEKLVNRITAIIDENMNCISCNAPVSLTNKANAGHRYSVNAHRHIRFNLHNIHRQNVCCNKWKSGNPDGYDEGLEKIYGSDYANYVKSLKYNQYDLKLSVPEIVDACKKSREFIKFLSTIEDKSNMRIELRNLGNQKLGIYQ